jgi:SAM-dependent methyltransferase
MTTLGRWKTAQQYERNYWAGVSSEITSGSAPQFEWYRWRAEQLVKRLRGLGLDALTTGMACILEVGSGPVGVAAYFPGKMRIAVDPLHTFYETDEVLTALRNPAVQYRPGVGEKIPSESGSCDLVVIENCIDHVQDVARVVDELNRVLRPGGVLYLTVNSRTAVGYYMHRLLSCLRIDRGHPCTFTPDRAVALMRRHGFTVLQREVGSAWEAHLADLRGPGAKTRLKAALGVSEFLITLVAQKNWSAECSTYSAALDIALVDEVA